MSFVYIVVALIVGPALGGTISQEMRPEGKRRSSLKLWLGFAVVALVVDSCIATAGWLNETMPAATLVKGRSVGAVFDGFVAALFVGRRLS